MVCSHCHQVGHTYRTCPTITDDEKKAKEEEIKKKKEEIQRRRIEREQRSEQLVQRQQQLAQQLTDEQVSYTVSNPMNYEVALYWGSNNGTRLKRFAYCNSHSSNTFKCWKNGHRIVIFPFLEVCEGGADAMRKIDIFPNRELPFKSVFDMSMKDFDGTDIIIDKEYTPPKTELDEWKECALKSKFLLEQIKKITGGEKTHKHYENIEPFIDMVQDISIPSSCSEIDKERAGIPSTLTNIT